MLHRSVSAGSLVETAVKCSTLNSLAATRQLEVEYNVDSKLGRFRALAGIKSHRQGCPFSSIVSTRHSYLFHEVFCRSQTAFFLTLTQHTEKPRITMRRLSTLCSQRHMSSKYVNVTPFSSFVRHCTGESPQRMLSFIPFHSVLIPIPFEKLTRLPPLWRSCLISSVTCSGFPGTRTCCSLTDFPPMAQDGVLVRGDNALPAAKRALSILDGNNQFGMYVFFSTPPFIARPDRFRSKIPYLLVNDTSCFPLSIKLNYPSAN